MTYAKTRGSTVDRHPYATPSTKYGPMDKVQEDSTLDFGRLLQVEELDDPSVQERSDVADVARTGSTRSRKSLLVLLTFHSRTLKATS